MKLPFITLIILGIALAGVTVPVDNVTAQTEMTEEHFVAKGLLTGVSGDILYVDKTPFRITDATRIIMPAGYEVKFLVYEDDLDAAVRFEPDEASNGRDIPLAVVVKLSQRLPQ